MLGLLHIMPLEFILCSAVGIGDTPNVLRQLSNFDDFTVSKVEL